MKNFLFFSIGFTIPVLLLIFATIIIFHNPSLEHLSDILGGCAFFAAMCIVGTLFVISIDD